MNQMELNQQFETPELRGRDVEQNNTLSSAVAMNDQTRPVALTTRQREVMLWTAEGKTAFEISVIVGLTERTVNFHIGRVLAKLGANNKTQAAVRAALMGLLFEERPGGHRHGSLERDTLSR
jgi:LuxR family transcriptional regulator